MRFQDGSRWFSCQSISSRCKRPDLVGKVQVVIQCRAAPDAAGFDAAMLDGGGFDEIRRATGFEQQSDIAFQLRLVALDREMIVRPLLDYIVGYRALGQ